MLNLMEEALNQLAKGGDTNKAQVYALLLIAQALQSASTLDHGIVTHRRLD